jgi:hypothetical protein
MKLSRLLPIALLMASMSARAQFAVAPVAGLNASFAYTAIEGRLYKSDYVGMKAGAIGEMEITPSLYIQLGALYSSYGFTNLNVKLHVDAIEVPVGIVFKTGKPGQNRCFAGIGPYIGYQFNGTLHVTDAYLEERKEDATDGMRKAYLGMEIKAGYQIAEGVFTRVSFQPGLAQLIKPDLSFTGYYSAQGSISIGYMIGNKPQTPKGASLIP